MREEWNDEQLRADICYVRVRGLVARAEFVDFLEKNGYSCEEEIKSQDTVIESEFPVKVDMEHKKYGCLQTKTSAAAAVSSGNVFSVQKFYAFLEFVSPYIII